MLIKEPEMLLTDAFCEQWAYNAATRDSGRGKSPGSRWWKGLLAGGLKTLPRS